MESPAPLGGGLHHAGTSCLDHLVVADEGGPAGTTPVIQAAGPAAFAWWLLGFVVFLLASVIVTGQLGRTFPGEGSIGDGHRRDHRRLWVAAVLRSRLTQTMVNVIFLRYGPAIALLLVGGVTYLASSHFTSAHLRSLGQVYPARFKFFRIVVRPRSSV